MKFIDLPVRNQQDFIRTMSVETDIPEQIIEKDWWVSAVMRAIFALPYADAMSFKGGLFYRGVSRNNWPLSYV